MFILLNTYCIKYHIDYNYNYRTTIKAKMTLINYISVYVFEKMIFGDCQNY